MVIWNLKKNHPYIHHFSSILCSSSKQKNRSQKNATLKYQINKHHLAPLKRTCHNIFCLVNFWTSNVKGLICSFKTALGTCPMVASPCGSSRVVLRTTSPHRAASPVTTATASASSMAALSPVRARVRLPERSPMKARVLEARRKKNHGNWQTYCFQMFP